MESVIPYSIALRLRSVVWHMKQHPERVDMAYWQNLSLFDGRHNLGFNSPLSEMVHDSDFSPACGTTCCFAGWVCTTLRLTSDVKERKGRPQGIPNLACVLLDLSIFRTQALFNFEHWPISYRSRYEESVYGSSKRVEVLEQRIEHYIQYGI